MTFIERFAPLASNYDVLLCDVWGVVHNGVAAFTEAAEALARFRARGGTVIFITNAPYPADAVQRFLDRLGVRHDAYDAIISSGDVTRSVVEKRLAQHVFHLGPPRGLPIFAGLKVAFAPVESADYVVCSGLFDDRTETPENYRDMLAFMRGRSLFMVCANPDAVVERGDTLVYCAGALADAYVALGGEALYCGKPHAPIYEAALCKAAAFRGGEVPQLARVLAIGDSVNTDLKGAAAFGVDCLFVISGLHADQFGLREAPHVAGVLRLPTPRPVGHSPTCVVSVRLIFEHHCVRVRTICPLLSRIPKWHRVFQKFISAMPLRRHSQSSGGLPGPPSSQVTAYCLR